MYDYPERIKEFISQYFKISTPENAKIKYSTEELLDFIWDVFPKGCISDYQLAELLNDLGHKQYMFIVESKQIYEDDEGNKKVKISKKLKNGWCFTTDFDLREEDFSLE